MSPDPKSTLQLIEEVETLQHRVADLEAEWAQCEARNFNIFGAGPVVFFKWRNQDGWPTEYVSASAEKILGYSTEEFVTGGLNYADIIASEDMQRVADEVTKHSASGVEHFEHQPYQLVRKDGRRIWVADYTGILRDNEGNISHYLGYILDITKRIREQQELALYRSNLEDLVEERTQKLQESEKTLSLAQEIAHVGSWSLDISKNELPWSDEVYRIFGLEPKQFGATYEAFVEAIHPADRECVDHAYSEALKNHSPYEVVHRVLRPDGEVRVVREKSIDVVDESGEIVRSIGMVHDITERTMAEQKIRASLEEKEILLREIHHRVKNNLQVVMSLLRLQARRISDPEARAAFNDSQGRIRAMAVIHETLSQSNSLSEISCKAYIKDLVDSLAQSHTGGARLTTDISETTLHIDQAVPVGLIINELVANAMEHAFSDGGQGEIKITTREVGELDLELVVSDNGAGLSEEFNLETIDSLGLRLVTRLAKDQLGGTLEISGDGGARFSITFKRKMNDGPQ